MGVRNAAARRLMQRGRFREALDVLNEAIRLDPRYAESYENRAAVFERMGMYPQADADRRKVAALGGVRRPPPPEPVERAPSPPLRPVVQPPLPPPPPPQPAPAELPAEHPVAEPGPPLAADAPLEAVTVPESSLDEPASTAEEHVGAQEASAEANAEPTSTAVAPYAVPPRRRGSGAAAARAFATLLITIGLFAAAGVGIFLALDALGNVLDGNDETASVPGDANGDGDASGTTDGAATPSPDPESPEEALRGDPLSFTRLASAWQEKGITATAGGINGEVTGFAPTPVTVTLSRGGSTMEVAVLLYDSIGGITEDWDLGGTATPKSGRSIPNAAFAWYNLNAVVVVLVPNDAIRGDARDAFLAVGA